VIVMFDVYCPHCASLRLIFSSQVTGIRNSDDGIVVSFTCWCGEAGAWRPAHDETDERVSWLPATSLAS
jgi:hypothetical protein